MPEFALISRQAHPRGVALSVACHLALAAALLALTRLHPPQLAATQLPGTAAGNAILVYYSPGAPPRSTANVPRVPKPSPVPSRAPVLPAPRAQVEKAQVSADNGTGDATDSGLGQGDLQIALPSYFPPPKPSLTTMGAGTAGDVILDATIDEHGHITQLTVLKGLTPAINQEVIATVQQWTYTPATRDGVAVASGQELHFHFERTAA